METPIRDLKLKLAKELLDPEITYRMIQLTSSIAMEMASIAKLRSDHACLLPVGNSKPVELQLAEALVFESVMASIDGKSNAEQRAAKMAIALEADEHYQEALYSSTVKNKELETHEATLKGYKMEWQVIQENMMNLRAAAALLEGLSDIEVKTKKEKKAKNLPSVESVPDRMMERILTPEQ